MKKLVLAGVSILAVGLLILGSQTNVVGYQTVQASQQNLIKERTNQKELLFQTILDLANNKDIQRIILKSQISREEFFNPNVRFSILNTPVLTKNQLKHMYLVGLMLSKIISKSKMYSMVERYQFNSQETQKEISAVIEKDSTLSAEITQLSNSECDCENENTAVLYFPVLCTILVCIFALSLFLFNTFYLGAIILIIADILITIFQCIYP